MNGSRANASTRRDIFQDFDIVYAVTDMASFKNDPRWVDRFGERIMMQLPDAMDDSRLSDSGRFAYLMQFADGNRIDLTLVSIEAVRQGWTDSQSLLLLDKDGIAGTLVPSGDSDYLPKPPTASAFADCCNEFWWVCPYVAKGLWRREIIYAKHCLDHLARTQLM